MIKGYGMNDEVELALQCFNEMHKHGVHPDNITFTCLLHACSRAKLQHKGREIFRMMIEKYGISPTIDHYTCMVDLYAKSGCLVEIEDFLNPVSEPSLWTALLTACKMHGERDLGNRCFEQLVRANPDQAAPYILMTKTYLNDDFIDDISYA
jgi:pentatricopeptide repeat protein